MSVHDRQQEKDSSESSSRNALPKPHANRKMTIHSFCDPHQKFPLVCVSLYDYKSAVICDPFVDMILVGDSLGMLVYGDDDTLNVTLGQMIAHGKAVVKGAKTALVVVDMPFGTYETSPEKAFKNASRVLRETGCDAVKLECSEVTLDTVSYLTKRGIPVMGHMGLCPQRLKTVGEYHVVPHANEDGEEMIYLARALVDAGVFSIVVEAVRHRVADRIVDSISVPVIGIGASENCRGQILVLHDLLGMSADVPCFVKTYSDVAAHMVKAVQMYSEDVRSGQFPSKQNVYGG
jgi:3-methyl-2-oxobutanoate hydroxymethyltransferase